MNNNLTLLNLISLGTFFCKKEEESTNRFLLQKNDLIVARVNFIITLWAGIVTGSSCRQFHQHFTQEFFVLTMVWQLFLRTYVEKSCWNDVCTKNLYVKCWWNWHLGSKSSTFYEQLLRQYSCAKKLQSQTVIIVIRENLHITLLYKKGIPKMLMKLTRDLSSSFWRTT